MIKRMRFGFVLLSICLGVSVWQGGTSNLQASDEELFSGPARSPPKYIPGWKGISQELLLPSKTITAPPDEPVRWTAEWEPMTGTLMAWPLEWSPVQTAFSAMVDALQNVGIVYMLYDTENEKAQVIERLTTAGVPLDNIEWLSVYPNALFQNSNDNWTRDYGPENILGKESGRWGIVDNRYSFTRKKEDRTNKKISKYWEVNYFETGLKTEGGNMSSDGAGRVFCTTWIMKENPNMTESQLRQSFQDYYGSELVILPKPPVSPHIDMCAKLVGPGTWIIGEWPPDDPNTPVVEEMVIILQGMKAPTGEPYSIHRVPQPARLESGYWRTYTNAYMHNGKVLVPTYNVPEDVDALSVYQEALPDWEIIGIDCRGFDGSGGAIHCSTHEIAGEGAAQLLIDR